MKTFTIALLAAFSITLVGCKDSSETLDDKPAIQSISFADVPDKDVEYDNRNSVITVKIPPVLNGGLKPIMKLTEGAEAIGLLPDGTIDLSYYCTCSKSNNEAPSLRIGNQKTTATYRLNIVTTGPLMPQDVPEETTFSLKTGVLNLSLPVQNLYANHHITQITLNDLKGSGGAVINADAACLNGCSNDAPSRMVFRILSPVDRLLKPGTYSIAIDQMKVPQRLIVTE